jgi:hydrogenase maturation protease
MKTLIIGYGNLLRGDDGVGPQVAEQLASQLATEHGSDVEVMIVQQLAPELAANIAQAEVVWFVDACLDPTVNHGFHPRHSASEVNPAPLPRIVPLFPTTTNTTQLDHAWSPGLLLHLSQILYDADPVAYQVLIPAVQFDYGAPLSPITQTGLNWTIATLHTLIDESPDLSESQPALLTV